MSANGQDSKAKNQNKGVVGQPLDRVDGRLKVTGGARYAVEFPVERTAYAALVGAGVANGRIKSIDASEAERVPGVLHIMTHENAPKMKPVVTNPAEGDAAGKRVPLQSPIVYYSGQYVAMVVAETLEQARRAADLLRITYDEQPPAIDIERERGNAKPPKGKVAGKPADVTRGNPDAGLNAAAVRVDEMYRTPTEHHNPMEPHATIALWEGERLTLYDATQGVIGARRKLAAVFGL
ncbi:MAG: xanthine dehydrogenase family protein molybdopterin-binding subunit, partial [Acidobacteria bacterium]|nr:xanthine dehydrogenase family protein molybdopterin-binding subunit [Acidobacteriota bacterium]